MNKEFLTIILVATILASCKDKDNDLLINGEVIDASTGQGISGVEVVLLGSEVSQGAFNPEMNFVTSDISESGGVFSLKFANESAVTYSLEISAEDYLNLSTELNPQLVISDQPYIVNPDMMPEGTLHIALQNVAPEDGDALTFQLDDFDYSCACCPVSTLQFDGPDIAYDQNCLVPAERWHRYVINYFTSSGANAILDSVWVSQGETSEIVFTF